MSKQSIAKEQQGYVSVSPCCDSCKLITSETKEATDWFGEPFTFESCFKCSVGGFAVKKRSYCKLYEPK